MDKAQLLESIYHSAGHIADAWAFKLVASFLVGALFNLHVQLLLLFALMVIVDLATKWFALAKTYLVDNGTPDPDSWQVFTSMRKARQAGYIKSDVMKHRFLGKIIIYMTVTFVAAVLDMFFKMLDKPEFGVVLTVGYLAITEFLSILENLQSAGVKEASQLHDLIERKGQTKL
jgi:phage-related holin